MNSKNILKMVYCAVFIALIFVGTQFIRVPLPFGYFNMGDCFILLSAWIMGGAYAVIASSIGAVLADVLSGYALYVPATLVIKSLMVVGVIVLKKVIRCENEKKKVFAQLGSALLAELIMVGGYFVYDTVLYGFAGATAAFVGNIIQGAVAIITFVLFVGIFEKSVR